MSKSALHVSILSITHLVSVQRKAVPSRGPWKLNYCNSSRQSVEMQRIFLLNILQRVFIYHTLVTKITQLCERLKVLPADYKTK